MLVPKTLQAFPGTCTHTSHLQSPEYIYIVIRATESPQTQLTLMCFHLTLLIHRTHAQTHMEAHAQVYEQTQVNVRFTQACMKTDPHTHIWCTASTSTILEELQHAPKSQCRVFSGTENPSSIHWLFPIR